MEEKKELIFNSSRDLFKIGAYLYKINFFKDRRKLLAYWWLLVILTNFCQFFLFYCVYAITPKLPVPYSFEELRSDEAKYREFKDEVCSIMATEKTMIVLFMVINTCRSFHEKMCLLHSPLEKLPMYLKLLIALQILYIGLVFWISLTYILNQTEILEMIMNFLGLITLCEIDNWAGLFFEFHLNCYHDEILKDPSYLNFETT